VKLLRAYFTRLVAAASAETLLRLERERGVPSLVLDQIEGLYTDIPNGPASRPEPGCMRIALVCREYPPETAFGGMATFSYHLAHGLIDAGHAVSVISLGGPSIGSDFNGRVDVFRIQPKAAGQQHSVEKLNRLGRLSWSENVFFYSLGAYKQLLALEAAHGPFDVIDLPDHAAEGVIPVLFWPGARTVRLYSPFSLLHHMRAGFYALEPVDSLYVLEKAALRHASLVTSPSRELADRTETFFGLRKEIHPLPNPLDTDLFRPAPKGSARVRVCFVGRLELRKGITTLLEAIPRVLSKQPNVEFHIVGSDLCGFRSLLPSGVKDRVQFTERVPLTELAQVYQQADITVVPSQYDNSPYTCMESMACGTPVIGAAAGGMPEYMVDGETGILIPAQDPGALANAILKLAGEPVLRARMGQAARRRMVECFDYRRIARAMADYYRLAIAANRPAESSSADSFNHSSSRDRIRCRQTVRTIEMIVLAKKGQTKQLEQTLASASEQGPALRTVAIIWQGADPPVAFRGYRVFPIRDNPLETAQNVFGTVLADAFLCLRAGDILKPSATDKIVWQFNGYRDVGLIASKVRRSDGAQRAYPVFRAEAARGFVYDMQGKTPDWGDIVRYLYDRVRHDGWREAVLEESLVNPPKNADELAVTGALRNEPPLEAATDEWELIEWQASNPIQQRNGGRWYQILASSCIRARSGPGFRLIRRVLRSVLLACRFTAPIAGWLIREKGLLGTGDLRPIAVAKRRLFVLAGSVEGAVRCWERLMGESRGEISSSRFCAVILGTQPTAQNGAALSAAQADLYDLPAMLPESKRLSAVRYLLRAYPEASVFCADDCPAGAVDLASIRSVVRSGAG
jgi:glycosyltransferase involved in cell wall biosynthesis